MHPRYSLCLATLLVVLSSCGQRDVATRALPAPTHQPAEHGIANLLATSSAPGQSIEVDAYHWVGYQLRASYALDAQGCPIARSFLSDWPVPEALSFPFVGSSNTSPGYPPDADPWLIPTSMLTTPLPATVDSAYNPATPRPSPPLELVGGLQIPYHGRLRGHLNDPSFATCPHNDRIFVVEGVTTVYAEAPPPVSMSPDYQPPSDYASWPRYHDAAMGYSFAYAPDWSVEPLSENDVLAAVAVRTAHAPDSPIFVRVHANETHIDPYDPASIPSIIKRRNKDDLDGEFHQDLVLVGGVSNGQHLNGFWVERVVDPTMRTMSVLISAHGRTYELTVGYAIGLHADQLLLDTYVLLLDRFYLDTAPELSPTPPIKQAVGAGPFLSQIEAAAAVRQKYGDTFELLEARLVSEAEMRGHQAECGSFFGHPDGVWMLRVQGVFEGARRTLLLGLNATTGEQLCGYELSIETPIPSTIQSTETVSPGYPVPSTAAP